MDFYFKPGILFQFKMENYFEILFLVKINRHVAAASTFPKSLLIENVI
jgi:hypothetical protein